MNFSGRSAGYRGVAIRCPGCAQAMSQEALDQCEVDVCAACGGMWIDWFDGDLRQVASDAAGLGAGVGSGGALEPARSSNEPLALGACPRCTRQLVAERYVAAPRADAGAEARAPSDPKVAVDVLRCEECLGAFVSKTSAETLAAIPPDEEPPASSSEAVGVLEPLPWQRILAALRRLLGLSSSRP